MAKFYRDINGNYGLRRTDLDEARDPVPNGSTVIAFDETTNATILDSLDGKASGFLWQDHTISGGNILRAGVAMVIAADSGSKQDLDGLLSAATNAVAANVTYLAIAAPTNAQVVAQLRAITQQSNAIIKRLVRLGRLQG